MWNQKKWVGQGTMTPPWALQMRSAVGTDILMQKTGSFWGKGTKIQHTSEEYDEGGWEKSHGHANTVRKMRVILLENDDTRGKPIEMITWNKACGNRRPYEYVVCESWFLVVRCTANRYACIECARCQTFTTKDTVNKKGGSLTRRKFQRYEEVERDRIWREFSWIQKNDGTALTPRGSWKTGCIKYLMEKWEFSSQGTAATWWNTRA